MKTLVVFTLGLMLLCTSCIRSTSSSSENKGETALSATISASPNPIPPGGELGETTISWNTGNDEPGQVYVSKNGAAEQLFGKGPSGSRTVNWIRVHTRYEFRLLRRSGA